VFIDNLIFSGLKYNNGLTNKHPRLKSLIERPKLKNKIK
jgi:hypothetical protein